MGKSDSLIFPEYLSLLNDVLSTKSITSIAFLGFPCENELTRKIRGLSFILEPKIRHFYDLQLGNWDINSDWSLLQKYDLIVCTRTAYFAKNPDVFINKCNDHLKDGGYALIDWGLGDHWRFKQYKVGWVRNDEHEYAYKPDNFLYSCFWNDDLEKDENVNTFWTWVTSEPSFGYLFNNELKKVVYDEVPSIVSYKTHALKCVTLWHTSPQLYIITIFQKHVGAQVVDNATR